MFSEKLIKNLQNAKHLVVFTGAGVSAESGIPTFRDIDDGLWENFDVMKIGTLQGYLQDPLYGWGWYEWARHEVFLKQPNPAHYAIAQLAKKLPKVTVVTQNVDDLHERAGSSDVLHIHGELNGICCVNCNYKNTLSQDRIAIKIEAPQSVKPDICPECGSIMRPNVVWFGENLPQDIWQQAENACMQCDLMLVIGTSGLVYPAASLVNQAICRKTELVQINPVSTDIDELVTYSLFGKAAEILPKLFENAFSMKIE